MWARLGIRKQKSQRLCDVRCTAAADSGRAPPTSYLIDLISVVPLVAFFVVFVPFLSPSVSLRKKKTKHWKRSLQNAEGHGDSQPAHRKPF